MTSGFELLMMLGATSWWFLILSARAEITTTTNTAAAATTTTTSASSEVLRRSFAAVKTASPKVKRQGDELTVGATSFSWISGCSNCRSAASGDNHNLNADELAVCLRDKESDCPLVITSMTSLSPSQWCSKSPPISTNDIPSIWYLWHGLKEPVTTSAVAANNAPDMSIVGFRYMLPGPTYELEEVAFEFEDLPANCEVQVFEVSAGTHELRAGADICGDMTDANQRSVEHFQYSSYGKHGFLANVTGFPESSSPDPHVITVYLDLSQCPELTAKDQAGVPQAKSDQLNDSAPKSSTPLQVSALRVFAVSNVDAFSNAASPLMTSILITLLLIYQASERFLFT